VSNALKLVKEKTSDDILNNTVKTLMHNCENVLIKFTPYFWNLASTVDDNGWKKQ